jgi:hypothetical protein
MKTRISIALPRLLGAVLAGLILPAKLALAQSAVAPDKKDQEIELLQLQVKKLEQRVDTLEGLGDKVKGSIQN